VSAVPGLPSAEELSALPAAGLAVRLARAYRLIAELRSGPSGPVKVQQRGSGGAWRTLDGLADFAIVESYLSTAAKWGITKLDAHRDLFNGHAWKPPGLEPAG
jgi:hypothetical protein